LQLWSFRHKNDALCCFAKISITNGTFLAKFHPHTFNTYTHKPYLPFFVLISVELSWGLRARLKQALAAAAAAQSAIGGGSMVHRLEFDFWLRRLAAADGGRSGD